MRGWDTAPPMGRELLRNPYLDWDVALQHGTARDARNMLGDWGSPVQIRPSRPLEPLATAGVSPFHDKLAATELSLGPDVVSHA